MGGGNSSGPQNVIFGTAAVAPDVIRTSPYWGTPPNTTTIFDEAGAYNSIFTTAGIYELQFSFRNEWAQWAGHGDIYLLVDAQPVPEPGTLLLLGSGLVGLVGFRKMKG